MAERDIPIIGPILNKLIGTRNERFVKRYLSRAEAINAHEAAIRRLTDPEIRAKLGEFRARLDAGAKADDLMVEAFAVAREAMDRAVGIRNIFNPKSGFDPSRLPAPARALYESTKASMDALAPIMPATARAPSVAPGVGAPGAGPGPGAAGSPGVPDADNAFRGCAEAVPGWQQADIPVALYEAVRELYPESRPPFRARPFDVQLIGGMVLTQGKIAEMKTGEGKTIVAPLACYLACIQRQRVHVVTVNDYLVQRDRDWTFPYFRALGLTVGAIHPQHMQDEGEKRQMYLCEVVYGTTAEFGFDYLRDNMKRRVEDQVQRRRQFAIVDEVDSILIDEARTPLIISGPAHEDQPRYELADRLARHLVQKNRPWFEANEKVEKCKMRVKGIEGDIRQARDKSKVPDLQRQLQEAKGELPHLESERDKHVPYYEVKLERKQAHVTHDGVAEAQRAAGIGSLYVDQNIDLPHLLEQSVRAHAVYERDKDYVIMNIPDQQTGRVQPSVVIVDVNTGRPMIGRQWSDGLHQAIECKEKVPIKQETQTVATITIQNFFKMYKRLAGMTGTADTEAQEFHDIYKLDVVQIPTNKAMIRRDYDDLVFLGAKDKWSFIVDEIKAFHDVGRPILVGTTSVEKSEMLSKMLMGKHGIQHEVLNAKQHEREAHIVENAGQLGAVMIATNMAGRGTDIKLGAFTRAALLEHWLKRGLAPRTLAVDAGEEQIREAVYRKLASKELEIDKKEAEALPFAELELRLLRHWAFKHTWLAPGKIDSAGAETLRAELDRNGRFLLHRLHWFGGVEDMGGLHVIGTERHESRRIDNQLRGRSGRQGDKGSSRFFVSFEDDLMKLFAGETTLKILSRLGMKEGDAIEHPMVSKNVERAQRKVEERNFQIRKNILEYDEVMEHQRQTFYGLRQRVLEGRDTRGLIFDYVRDSVGDAVRTYLHADYPAQCVADYAREKLECMIPVERIRGKERDEMEKALREEAKYDARHTIDVTMGEFMPMAGSEVAVDFDSAGLAEWARSRFGVELDTGELREGGDAERRRVRETLVAAAERGVDQTDLGAIDEYLQADYGVRRLVEWVRTKFGFEVSMDEIVAAQKDPEATGGPQAIIMRHAEALYRKREVEDPVDFTLDLTQVLMRQGAQQGPQALQQAANHIVTWSNQRFGLDWTPEIYKTLNTPQLMREELLKHSETFVAEGTLEKTIERARACATDADLEAFFRDRFKQGLPDTMRFLHGQERDDAIRARVENLLRAELLYFERTIMLDTLDTLWRDHLYAMDQLRDTINFRAFSQNDPRIEYKREGSQMFTAMLQSVRDRVTDLIFKARLTAPGQQQPAPRGPGPGAPAPRPAQRPAVGPARIFGNPTPTARPTPPLPGGQGPVGGGSVIAGPGL